MNYINVNYNHLVIHRMFQHDLFNMKLIAARAYVKAISTSLNPMTSNSSDPIKLSAQVII